MLTDGVHHSLGIFLSCRSPCEWGLRERAGFWAGVLALLVFALVTGPRAGHAQGAEGEPIEATIDVGADGPTISRHIYGHFAEHLGRDIYGGFWVQRGLESSGEGAGTPTDLPEGPPGGWKYNEDVIEALRAIDIPNVRWPGGCFADYYHWKDGIGARAGRPTTINTLWGGVVENNTFGTHEFMGLVERLGAEPVIVGNVGSGTPEEMAGWWAYLNAEKGQMAERRAENGRPEPWNVRYWGVGNESWGCGGHMTPSYYADLYKRFATYLPDYGEGDDPDPFFIAAGPDATLPEGGLFEGGAAAWTRTVMKKAAPVIDGLDLHRYTVGGTWADKGSATDFGEDGWFAAMQNTLRMDTILARHAAIMDEYDPERRVALIVGEWGMWHEVKEGTTPGFLYQQNALRDALVAALHLNIFNRHADRVRMANLAQTVNVLQAMILTREGEMVKTPTYHVFDLYQSHMDAMRLPVRLDRGSPYAHEGKTLPAVSASASKKGGRTHVTLANIDPDRPRTVEVTLQGAGALAEVSGRVLTADAMNAHNTFDDPDAVTPAPFDGATLDGRTLTVELPAQSVVALRGE